MDPKSALLDLLENLRAESIAQDAMGLAALYAEDAVHEFPFTTPGGPTRIEGRAGNRQGPVGTVYRSLPLRYTAYRTIAVHQVSETTLVVEQDALGINTKTGVQFVSSYSAGLSVGGSHAPVVKSWRRASSLSSPHLVAVSR